MGDSEFFTKHEYKLVGKNMHEQLELFHKQQKEDKYNYCKSHGRDCGTCDISCDDKLQNIKKYKKI